MYAHDSADVAWPVLFSPFALGSYDFNQGVNYDEIMKSYLYMGYQGTNLGEAIEEVKRMVRT
jgi:deoxyhypusine synthase